LGGWIKFGGIVAASFRSKVAVVLIGVIGRVVKKTQVMAEYGSTS
jgi:hypothetical protein